MNAAQIRKHAENADRTVAELRDAGNQGDWLAAEGLEQAERQARQMWDWYAEVADTEAETVEQDTTTPATVEEDFEIPAFLFANIGTPATPATPATTEPRTCSTCQAPTGTRCTTRTGRALPLSRSHRPRTARRARRTRS